MGRNEVRTSLLFDFELKEHSISQKFNRRRKPAAEHIINEEIIYPKMFVVGPDNEKIGILTREQALLQAQEMRMDLVLISIHPKPIARILDYGKFKYDRKKKQKEEKTKQSRVENRQIRLTPMIGENDIKIKAKKAREFILNGDFVKISLKFRGREMQRPELGEHVLDQFYNELADIAVPAKPRHLNGRFLDMFLQQDKKKVLQYEKQQKLNQETEKEGAGDAKNEDEKGA